MMGLELRVRRLVADELGVAWSHAPLSPWGRGAAA
jgi:hypothetical protein